MDDLLDRLDAVLGIKKPKQDVDRVTGILDRMQGSVVSQESGGRQGVRNERTDASGLYQVMPANIAPWTRKYVGREMSQDEFLRDKTAQDKVFRGEMGKYIAKALPKAKDEDEAIRMGSAAWYGGEGAMHRYDDPTKFRPNEPSFREYTSSILNKIKKGGSQTPQVDTLLERLNKVTQGVTADEPSDPLLDRLNAVTATLEAPDTPSGKKLMLPTDKLATDAQLPPVNPTGVPLKTNATVMPEVAEQPIVAEPPIAVQQQPSVLQDRPQPFVETPAQQIAPTQRRVAKGQPQPIQTPVQQAPQPRYETSEAVVSDVPEERVGLPVEAIQRGQEGNAVADTITIDPNLSPQDGARQGLTELARKYGLDVNKILQENPNLQASTATGKVDVTYDDLKRMGVDTDALISQKMAESRIETPQPDLNLKGLPKFSQVDKTEDELRDQYRKEEIAKLDPSSVNRWISELIKNPFSRAMDAYDAATGQVTDIDKIVNERINALPQSGQGRRSVEQYNPENDAPFPIAKAASLGSNFYKGLVVDNFAPMLETAGYGQALFDNYILGKPTAVKDTSLFKSASAMRDTHEKGLAKMPDAFGEEQFTRTLGQAAGTMLLAATGANMVSPANLGKMTLIQQGALGISQQSSEAYRTAIAKGATEDQARLAAMLAAPGGLVEGLSEAKIFSSLKRIQGLDLATNGKFSSQLMGKFKEISKSANEVGISELIEEGVQGLSSEVAAQLAYRKNDRDLKGFLKDIDEMAKNAILAYPVGALLGGGTATAQIMAESGSEAEPTPPRQSRTDALLKTEVPQKTEPVIEPIKMGAERTAPNPLASSDGLKTVDGIPIVGTDVEANTKVRLQPLNETKTEVSPQPPSVETQPLVQTQKDNSGNFEPPVKETKPTLTPAEQTAAIKASNAEVAKAEAEQEAPKVESTTLKSDVSVPSTQVKDVSPKVENIDKPKIPITQKPLTQIEAKGDKVYNKVEFSPKAVIKESLIAEPKTGEFTEAQKEDLRQLEVDVKKRLPATLEKADLDAFKKIDDLKKQRQKVLDSGGDTGRLEDIDNQISELNFGRQADNAATDYGVTIQRIGGKALAVEAKPLAKPLSYADARKAVNAFGDKNNSSKVRDILARNISELSASGRSELPPTTPASSMQIALNASRIYDRLNTRSRTGNQDSQQVSQRTVSPDTARATSVSRTADTTTRQQDKGSNQGATYTDGTRTGTLETMPNGTQRIRLRPAKAGSPMDGTTAMSARWKPTSEPMESAKDSPNTITDSKGNIDYAKSANVTGRIERGEATIKRLDTDGEQGRIAGGKRAIESSIILARSERASEKSGSRTRPVERQERTLEEYAKRAGIWIDPREAQQNIVGKGNEATVHSVDNGKSVQKVIDYKQLDKNATPLDFIDNRIATFNHIFPETKYELVGFTRTKDGFRFVIKQPLIRDAVYTTAAERQAFMKSKGFEMVDKYGEEFANEFYHVSDLHEKNALKMPDGSIVVIDAVTKAKPVSEFEVVDISLSQALDKSPMERSREEMEASKESFEAAKKLPIEELLAIADPKKITHEDGIIEIPDVPERELIRRIAGNAFGSPLRSAVFYEPDLAQRFIKTSRELGTEAEKNGVDGQKFRDLAQIVEDATKANGTAIIYMDDRDLGEEKAHRTLYFLRTGERVNQVPREVRDKLLAEKIVAEKALKGKFGRAYGSKKPETKMEEFAVKAARGQWEDFDYETQEERNAAAQIAIIYLDAFAEANLKEGQTKDEMLRHLAQELVYGEEARDIQETYESKSRSSVQSTENLNKQVADGRQGKTVSGEQYEPNSETKLSQTPISAREKANIPLKDEQYVSASNAEQQEFADRQLAKGADSAMDWFKSQVADNNLNNGATGVVGLNLANHYGMQGNYAKMNEVAELLVPAITEAAQSVQAMRVLSKFDPQMALTYAATRKMKATNKPLTDREIRRLNPKIEKLANAENDKNVTENAVENLTQGIANADSVSQGLQTALNDATKATTADPTTVRTEVEASRKQSRPRPKKADRAEIEARIRAAFVTEVMESARGTDQTETPNFKRWFKDSKVVNGKGEPLITFRGESEERQILEGGAFFTDSPKDASAYAELAALTQAVENNEELSEIVNDILTEEGGEALTDLGPKTIRDIAGANGIDLPKTDGYIYQTYLRMENPLDLTEFGSDVGDVADLWDKLHNKGLLDEAWSSLDEDVQQEVEQDYDRMALYRFLEAEGIQAKAFEKGFDGVIFTDMSPDGGKTHTTWLVKDPLTQVKSAIGNNGNFDPQRQEIMESAREDFGNDKYQDLIDLIALDILDYKTPAETYNHIQLLTGEAITPEQFVELQLDGWRASKAEKDFTPTENLTTEQREAREERIARRTARLAHQRMAFGTQGKKAGPQKPNVFDREIREQGIDRGYSDIEIVGAILMPKLSGTKATEDWYKQMKAAYPDTDVDTFARSYELRQSVLENVQEQRMLARAEKAGYEKDLPKFENELKHRNRLVREGQTDLDNEYRKLQRGWRDVALTGAAEAMGLFKGLTSWGEISYILRQGFIPLLTDTRAALKGDWQGVGHGLQGDNALWKWAAEKGGFEDVAQYLNDHSLSMFVEKIRQHPRFLEAQNNGVRFTQIGDFNIADDHFSTKMLEWIPMYKRAEVAYTLPGDLQRLFIYDSWAKGLDELGLTKEELKKAKKYAAETANAFTGKGDIGRVLARGGTLSKLASIAFYSPQLLISRFQSAYRLSTGFATAPKGMKLQMAKKGARFYGAIGLLMYLAGAVLDPEDDDFGKVNIKKDSWLAKKIPDARDLHIDMLAGLDLPIQTGMRLMMGAGKAVANNDRAYLNDAVNATTQELIMNKSGEPRLARSKLSPGASLLVDMWTGKDFLGRPTTAWGAFTSRALPLAWQQTYDALLYDRLQSMQREPQTRENAKMKLSNEQKYDNALLMMLGTFVGVGITQYPKDDPSKAMQLTRQLSTATSSKDAETKRTEGALRNLYKAQQEALRANEPVGRINQEIQSYMNKYPALRKEQNDLLSQAKSQTGLFSYYAKDVSLDGLLRIRKVAEGAELEVVNKLIKAAEKKKR